MPIKIESGIALDEVDQNGRTIFAKTDSVVKTLRLQLHQNVYNNPKGLSVENALDIYREKRI